MVKIINTDDLSTQSFDFYDHSVDGIYFGDVRRDEQVVVRSTRSNRTRRGKRRVDHFEPAPVPPPVKVAGGRNLME